MGWLVKLSAMRIAFGVAWQALWVFSFKPKA